MLFKGISYLQLWGPLCSAEWNHLYNFGRKLHEEQFCELILNLNQWLRRRRHLKAFLSRVQAAPSFSRAKPLV